MKMKSLASSIVLHPNPSQNNTDSCYQTGCIFSAQLLYEQSPSASSPLARQAGTLHVQ